MGAVRSLRDYQRDASEAGKVLESSASLDATGWPAECLEAERKFGHRAARLFPLLGVPNGVLTPFGPGTLLQAFNDSPGRPGAMVMHLRPRAWILEKGTRRAAAVFVAVEDVKPYRGGS